MEHESLSACRVIERVPDNRVPMMGEMHPDLMGTPRLKLAFNQAVAPDFFQFFNPSSKLLEGASTWMVSRVNGLVKVKR